MFYSGCEMIKEKPIRAKGQDIRTLPTYTIPEAAVFLAVNQRTLFSWYKGDEPILKASGNVGLVHLLSYQDLEEAYRVFLLREKYHYSLQFLRRSMHNARCMFKSQHPLQRADAIQKCLSDLVYDQPARGERPRTVTSLGKKPGQQFVAEVVDMFAERIDEGEFIFPWRFAAEDHQSRPVSINPNIMSGRLVVFGTRIPVKTIVGLKRKGMSASDIANDFSLDVDTVEKAIIHFGLRQKAA
jgi:uncharacterized protein (DUF433 family)